MPSSFWNRQAPAAVRAGAFLAALALLFGLLLGFLRPWYLTWGASEAEQSANLPGDRLLPGARLGTRAISIAAPAPQVFAWVAQLGRDRAGFYSYELLEDLLGSEMPNVQWLDPDLQRWSVGDRLWMYPAHKAGGAGYATLLDYEPGRALVFGVRAASADASEAPAATWAFVVEPRGERSSRLLVRSAGVASPSLLGLAFDRTVFEPLHFAMERRMLHGIRELAEGRVPSQARDAVMVAFWALCLAAFVLSCALALLAERFWHGLACCLAGGVAFQILTLVQPPLAVGGLLLAAVFALLAPGLAQMRRNDTPAQPGSASGDPAESA